MMPNENSQPETRDEKIDHEQPEPSGQHMGAEDSEVKQIKPAAQELAEMTNRKGQAADPADDDDDDFNPRDELTPG